RVMRVGWVGSPTSLGSAAWAARAMNEQRMVARHWSEEGNGCMGGGVYRAGLRAPSPGRMSGMTRFLKSPWPIATLLLLVGGAWLFWYGLQNKVGRDVSLAQCPIANRLPPTASHVSYVVGTPVTLCEFDVSEPHFLSWAKANGWNV